MKTRDLFYQYVHDLQSSADCSGELYPKNDCIFPNDAIVLLRIRSLNEFSDFVDKLAAGLQTPVETILRDKIAPNLEQINQAFPYIQSAISAIVAQFGNCTSALERSN